MSDSDDPKPPDDAPRAERTAWNRREHERRTAGLAIAAQDGIAAGLAPSVLARAHAHAGMGSRAAIKRATKATILAVLDPESLVSVKDRIAAASLGATITGLAKPVTVTVNNTVVSAFGAMSRVQGE